MIQLALAFLLAIPASAAVKSIPPEAEVSASSGPVQITFRVYKTRIRMAEGFWYQIELKNIGREMIVALDKVFWDPGEMYLAEKRELGIRFDTRDPADKWVGVGTFHDAPICEDESWSPVPFVERTPEAARLTSRWRKEGVSEIEIRNRLFERQKQMNLARPKNNLTKSLNPGDSISTPPYAERGWSFAAERLECKKQPIGQFAEFNYYRWKKPGRYRIRIIYDYAARNESKWRLPERVKMNTPWITIEVHP